MNYDLVQRLRRNLYISSLLHARLVRHWRNKWLYKASEHLFLQK